MYRLKHLLLAVLLATTSSFSSAIATETVAPCNDLMESTYFIPELVQNDDSKKYELRTKPWTEEKTVTIQDDDDVESVILSHLPENTSFTLGSIQSCCQYLAFRVYPNKKICFLLPTGEPLRFAISYYCTKDDLKQQFELILEKAEDTMKPAIQNLYEQFKAYLNRPGAAGEIWDRVLHGRIFPD
jgi:hypothetical protein